MDIVNLITGGGVGPADIVALLAVVRPFIPPTYKPILALVIRLIDLGAFNWFWARNEAKPGDPMIKPKSGRHVGG